MSFASDQGIVNRMRGGRFVSAARNVRGSSGMLALTVALLGVIWSFPGTVQAQDELKILSYPVGIVVGKIQVAVDLGSSAQPAELYLDGRKVCDLRGRPATCTVDLGPDPHLHLLEAVRKSEDGAVLQQTRRWLNRPGEEVELDLLADRPTSDGKCSAAVRWAHPNKLSPTSIAVTLDGWPLVASRSGHHYVFDCPANFRSAVLTAYATFPDGRSAYAATTIGGFTGSTVTPMSAVALTTVGARPRDCSRAALWSNAALPVEDEGFELAVILDPTVNYRQLERSGRTGPVAASSAGAQTETASQWLQRASNLWYVTPDSRLRRVDGFANGRAGWLDVLFHVGQTQLRDASRIADAVAVAGKQAADGPYRRAVVLLLGDHSHKRNDATFTPTQARAYLRELGVPLIVLRDGQPRDDGWGEGLPNRTMQEMRHNLDILRRVVTSQCVFWFEGDRRPTEIASTLTDAVRVAGAQPISELVGSPDWTAVPETQVAERSSESAYSAMEEAGQAPSPAAEGTSQATPRFAGRIDVTSVTVLVSARNAQGRPVSGLSAADLKVTEDGKPVEILGLHPVLTALSASEEPATPAKREAPQQSQTGDETGRATAEEPLPVTIFIDPTLSGRTAVRQATTAIEGQLDRLVALGPVEIVLGTDPAQTRLAPTRDAAQLRKALDAVESKVSGRSEVERIRSQFIRDTKRTRHVTTKHDSLGSSQGANPEFPSMSVRDDEASPGMPGSTPGNQYRMAVRSAVGQESVVVRHALRRIGAWALGQPGRDPRLLIVVGAAFDEQPEAFYLPFLRQKEPPSVPLMRAELEEHDHGEEVRRLGDDLAGAGWRVMALGSTTSSVGLSASDSAEMAGDDRVTMMTTHGETGSLSTPSRLQLDPIGSQTHLAEPSGGEAIVGVSGLARALSGARGWYRLTYQVARPADGEVHKLEVRSLSPDVTLRSTSFVASTTTEGQAEARLARVLDGSGRTGELPIRLKISPAPSETKGVSAADLEVTADLSSIRPLAGDRPLRLRISVLVDLKNAQSVAVHRMIDLTALPSDGRFTYSVPMQWPSGEGRLAVSVEEIGSGSFGATVERLPR